MSESSVRTKSPEHYLVPTAIGMIMGGTLRLLGTPLMVLLLTAGIATAYSLGWRVIVTKKNTDRIIDV